MDADRSSRLRHIFDEALSQPASERESFITDACTGDEALRIEVMSLLSAFDDAHSFLAAPAREHVSAEAEEDAAQTLVGKRVGRYRIERLIATGGMGAVYEALQDQPHRKVAVKVIRAGISSRAVLRRFAHEAEILGHLRHPGIAQVFEAGAYDAGGGRVPFFAMEYIPEPRTIVEYANAQGLGPRERLELFAQVCDAVQHAHQHGVIHRDLKPGNILVDPAGQPKVLDFGVARATDADIQVTTLQTDIGQLVGTVPYMSPEQVRGNPDELDTRSDVYALGVVCYELLTGHLPYDVHGKPIPTVIRTIQEVDARPLGSVDRAYRGDVETIVGKALEKDPARRYQSAAGLAADIRRHLNDEPIVAHPPSTMYQLSKFARRNKALVGGTVAVFVVLVAGIIGVSVALARAVRAEKLAEDRLAAAVFRKDESATVVDFLAAMLASTDPGAVERKPRRGLEVRVKDILDQASATLEQQWAGKPRIKARLHQVIGTAYAGLSEFETAEAHLKAAYETRRAMLGEGHEDTERSLVDLVNLYFRLQRDEEAEQLGSQALAIQRRSLGEDHKDTLHTMHSLARAYFRQRRYDEAEALHKETLERRRRTLGEAHPDTLLSMSSLAGVYQGQGRLDEAEKLQLETLALRRRALGEDHPDTLRSMSNLAVLYRIQRRFDEAERLRVETLERQRHALGDDHPHTLTSINLLGTLYHSLGRYAEAEPLYLETVEHRRRVMGPEHQYTMRSVKNLAALYRDMGQYDRAEPLLRQAVDVMQRDLGPEHADSLRTKAALASLYQAQGRTEEAGKLFEETLETCRRVLGAQNPQTAQVMAALGKLRYEFGQFAAADALLQEAIASFRAAFPAGDTETAAALLAYGRCLVKLGRFEDAEAALLEAQRDLAAAFGEEVQQTRDAVAALVELYEAWGQPGAAARWRARATTTQPAMTHEP